MTDAPTAAGDGAPQNEFSIVRKGFDPAEVDAHLAESAEAFRDLEDYAARLKHELAEAKQEIGRLEAVEQEAIDRAMLAVFDAKERILERARQKAQEIEDEARTAAGLPPAAKAGSPVPDVAEGDLDELIGIAVREPATARRSPDVASAASAAQGPDGGEPHDALQQMLREANTIRSQLEEGLATAFDQIERMQRDAEDRATALLDEARTEANRLRSAGESPGKIEVTLADGEDEGERRSRYTRNSAKLPRIGEDAGVSVLASMNQLRNKLREAEEVARKVQDPPTG